MNLFISPIDMTLEPNFYAPTGKQYWTVTGGVATDLWGVLQISDNLGTRPYIPAVGATLTALFQRGELIGVMTVGVPPTATPNNNTVNKTCVLSAQNRSLLKMSLTSQEATNITSGSVVFTLTEGTTVNKWVMNWGMKKLNTTAGF